jgi:hypothetical protein
MPKQIDEAQGAAMSRTLTELLDAAEARFHVVMALVNAWQAAGWKNGEGVSGKQPDHACGREIGAVAHAHMRYREAEYALVPLEKRGQG